MESELDPRIEGILDNSIGESRPLEVALKSDKLKLDSLGLLLKTCDLVVVVSFFLSEEEISCILVGVC